MLREAGKRDEQRLKNVFTETFPGYATHGIPLCDRTLHSGRTPVLYVAKIDFHW